DVGSGTSDGKLAFTTGFSKTRFTRGIDGDDDADNLNLQGRVDYNPFANTNISGRVYFSDAFVRLNGNPDTFGTLPGGQIIDANEGVNFIADQNDPDNFQRSDFFSGQLALTQIINSKAIFSASYQGLTTKRENENGVLGSGFQPFGGLQFSTFDGQIHTLNAKVNLTPVRNNLLTIGYEYEFERYGNEGFDANPGSEFFARVNQSSNTIFAQNLLGLFNDKLQLAGGFRVQFFSLDDPAFSVNNAPYSNLTLENPPNAYTFDGAASYYFAKTGTKIRGHVGNGYRVPSLYERFGTFPPSPFSPNFTAIGDPNLEPERSIAFDAGVEQGFMQNRVRLTATYFYTKLIDTIGYGNVVPNIGTTTRPFGGYFNTKGGIARGGEFSGQFKATNSTDIFTSYTFTNSDQRQSQVAGSGIIQTLGIPAHQFTLVATQRIGNRVTVNFDFAATSNYLAPIFSNTSFSTVVYRFNGNNRGDLSGRYSFLTFKEKYNFNIFGTIQNIFGYEYFENGFRTEGRTGRIGLGLNF
ncbi:MAG: TonB-dependent receptor plug domain-containing protein, partial [Aridibacter sp.]